MGFTTLYSSPGQACFNDLLRGGCEVVQGEQVHQEDGQDHEGDEGVQAGQEGGGRLPQRFQSLQNGSKGCSRVFQTSLVCFDTSMLLAPEIKLSQISGWYRIA